MKTVGLCGGSGSGKGTVCELLSLYGIKSIDTDAVYHSLVSYRSECLEELVSVFGEDIVKDGRLDRMTLRDIVFSTEDSAANRKILNEITHRHIRKATEQILKDFDNAGASAVIIDAPLLFESGFDSLCDVKICVCADEDVRIKRIMERDGLSHDGAFIRIRSQIPDSDLKERCDYVINNNGDLDSLVNEVTRIANILLEDN